MSDKKRNWVSTTCSLWKPHLVYWENGRGFGKYTSHTHGISIIDFEAEYWCGLYPETKKRNVPGKMIDI